MRGLQALVAMRKAGKVPGVVWIDAESEDLPFADDWPEQSQEHAHLQPANGESLRRHDLRCVIGLTVYVSGPYRERVHALRDAAIEAKAKRVIASVLIPRGSGDWTAYHLDETTDTEGVLTWPKS